MIKKAVLFSLELMVKTPINHIGMIVKVENTDIKFIHSSTNKGVLISSINENYYRNCVARINTIIE